nr:MAG TPA: ATPase [Caudoviricetes sp.]
MPIKIISNDESNDVRLKEDAFVINNVIESTITMDNVIMDDERKEMLLNTVSNFISFFSNTENIELFKDVYGYGNGLILLFTGTSGCGKTMLAHALANHFNKKIMMISSNSYLDYNSCYRENDTFVQSEDLIKCLAQVNKLNAIALMDEADKTDSRINNIANVMNMIEKFEGILIITTNNNSWCNGSLMRRINHIFRFDIPTQEEQYKIWKVTIPDTYTDWFKDVDFDLLSNKFNFTGGLIKNIIQSSIRDCYSSNNKKITTNNIVKISNLLSRQIFNQYYNTTDRIDHFFSADTNIHIQKKDSMIAINSKYYKDAYDKIDRVISSYDQYRKIKGIAMFSDGNLYDDTINHKGRVTFINSDDITYTLQIMLEVLRNKNETARIINQEILFDNKLISHPLYKEETNFITALSDPILGTKCPLIVVDNNINDIINKLIPDLKIIQKKKSKRSICTGYSVINCNEIKDISDTDENNYTTTLSAIGDLMIKLLHKDYSDTYILINSTNSNIEKLCASIDGIYYLNLRDTIIKDNKKLLASMIDKLNCATVKFDSKKMEEIIPTEALNQINPMSLSSLIKDAYGRAIVECKADRSDLCDCFYENLKKVYDQLYSNINNNNIPKFA